MSKFYFNLQDNNTSWYIALLSVVILLLIFILNREKIFSNTNETIDVMKADLTLPTLPTLTPPALTPPALTPTA